MTTAKFNPHKHYRRSIRLRNYDYRQAGAYFVTICVQDRACLLGEVVNGEMVLSAAGTHVQNCWLGLARRFQSIELDAFVVMPNHFHGIVAIRGQSERYVGIQSAEDRKPSPRKPGTQSNSLGAIVQNFKSISTRRINRMHAQPGAPFWQRNYYEHIIRNSISLERIRRYIADNPAQWDIDQLHPENPSRW